MINSIAVAHLKAGLSVEEFNRYYKEEHAGSQGYDNEERILKLAKKMKREW